MEGFKCFSNIIPLIVALIISVTVIPVYGQINTPCTASMITSVTPCLNFTAQSSGNGSSPPTVDCCRSLKSLLSTSMECACLIFTGSVPFQLPINRTLAISLPRACKLGAASNQCNGKDFSFKGSPPAASGFPLPAPAPSPAAAISPSSNTSPTASVPLSPSESDPTLDSPPMSSESPTGEASRGKPVLNTPPSSTSAKLSHISLPSGLFVVMMMVMKYYH